VFNLHELKLGTILNSDGHYFGDRLFEPQPAAGLCRLCGRPSWHTDEHGPIHACCQLAEPTGHCTACAASNAQHTYHYGWPA
jgi:hypothetical protein